MIILPVNTMLRLYGPDGTYTGFVYSKYECQYHISEIEHHLSWVRQYNTLHPTEKISAAAYRMLRNSEYCRGLLTPVRMHVYYYTSTGEVTTKSAEIRWFMFDRDKAKIINNHDGRI